MTEPLSPSRTREKSLLLSGTLGVATLGALLVAADAVTSQEDTIPGFPTGCDIRELTIEPALARVGETLVITATYGPIDPDESRLCTDQFRSMRLVGPDTYGDGQGEVFYEEGSERIAGTYIATEAGLKMFEAQAASDDDPNWDSTKIRSASRRILVLPSQDQWREFMTRWGQRARTFADRAGDALESGIDEAGEAARDAGTILRDAFGRLLEGRPRE